MTQGMFPCITLHILTLASRKGHASPHSRCRAASHIEQYMGLILRGIWGVKCVGRQGMYRNKGIGLIGVIVSAPMHVTNTS